MWHGGLVISQDLWALFATPPRCSCFRGTFSATPQLLQILPAPLRPQEAQSKKWLTRHQVFAGKDASRALGKTSTKAEDVSSEWKDLDDKEKGVLNDWVKFFSNRYNVVGTVEGATNFDDEAAAAAL